MDDGTINGVDPYRPDWERCESMWIPEPSDEPNPWRRYLEAKVLIDEAMRLLSGEGWRETRRLLDQASDSILYTIDAAGYNSWEYERPIAGKHEKPVATTT